MEASEQYRLLMADVYELAGLSRRTSEAIARELGQTVARWHVLSVLSAGPCTVPAAARRLGLTRQGVQRVAGDLLAARLLQASSNPDHVRSPLLTLTNRGQLVLEQLTQRSDAARGRLLHQARITAEDLEAARTTLRALLQSLVTPDRNFRPGIPVTGAELPVNDRMSGDAADHGVYVAAFGVQVGVGVGTFGPSVAVRDSNHPDGPQLAFPASTWQAFTDQVKAQLTPSRRFFIPNESPSRPGPQPAGSVSRRHAGVIARSPAGAARVMRRD